MSAVARRFELNDNLVHQWRRDLGAVIAGAGVHHSAAMAQHAEFVALPLPAPAAASAAPALRAEGCAQCIRIELRRGTITLNVSWPLTASAECAGWMRELLR